MNLPCWVSVDSSSASLILSSAVKLLKEFWVQCLVFLASSELRCSSIIEPTFSKPVKRIYENMEKIANLISKLNFYKLIPYPMDNCFTGRHDRSRQTTEKVILYKIPAGPVTECTFARCRLVHTSCLVRMTSSRLFSLSKPIRPLVS